MENARAVEYAAKKIPSLVKEVTLVLMPFFSICWPVSLYTRKVDIIKKSSFFKLLSFFLPSLLLCWLFNFYKSDYNTHILLLWRFYFENVLKKYNSVNAIIKNFLHCMCMLFISTNKLHSIEIKSKQAIKMP